MDFSVIIPAKNEESNIGLCLSTIRSVDYPQDRYEIILVDNGSIDGTTRIAESFGVRVFTKPGITIAGLRNYGASMASGKILVFLDADCSVALNWFKEASRYLDIDEVVCFGSPPVIPELATWVQSTWFKVRSRGSEVSDAPWLESMNMFIRKKAFIKIGGFDETLITCEDVDISYRLLTIGRLISDPAIKAVHHGDAATIHKFFHKERWRGKSNYQGLFRHGLKISEIPSLTIPLYYGLSFAFLIFNLLFFPEIGILLTTMVLWQSPILLMTLYKLKGKSENLHDFLKLAFLYNVYYSARFISMF